MAVYFAMRGLGGRRSLSLILSDGVIIRVTVRVQSVLGLGYEVTGGLRFGTPESHS